MLKSFEGDDEDEDHPGRERRRVPISFAAGGPL